MPFPTAVTAQTKLNWSIRPSVGAGILHSFKRFFLAFFEVTGTKNPTISFSEIVV